MINSTNDNCAIPNQFAIRILYLVHLRHYHVHYMLDMNKNKINDKWEVNQISPRSVPSTLL